MEDGLIPSILERDGSTKEHKRNWARLIQKIYEIDPLCCPACSGKMYGRRIFRPYSVIERPDVIKKILRHLGLWDRKARPPPKNVFGWEYCYFSKGGFELGETTPKLVTHKASKAFASASPSKSA